MGNPNQEALNKVSELKKLVGTYLKMLSKYGVSKEYALQAREYKQVYINAQNALNKTTITTVASDTSKVSLKERRKTERREARRARRMARAQNQTVVEAKAESPQERKGLLSLFGEVQNVWNNSELDSSGSETKAGKLLQDGGNFLGKANNFLNIAKAFTGDGVDEKINQVQAWTTKAEQVVNTAEKVEAQVQNFSSLASNWASVFMDISMNAGSVSEGVVGSVQQFMADAKGFLDNAVSGSKEVDTKIGQVKFWMQIAGQALEKSGAGLGAITEDKDGNNLPDWYDNIAETWNTLIGDSTDLIPFIEADDKFLTKAQDLKDKLEGFLSAATGKALGVEDKIGEVKGWLDLLNNGISALSGLGGASDDTDFGQLFEELKQMWEDKDFSDAPELLDQVITKADDFLAKANKYVNLAQLVTGDNIDAKLDTIKGYISTVRGWLDTAKQLNAHLKQYAEMATRWIAIAKDIKENGGTVAKEAAEQVRSFLEEAKAFANSAIAGHQSAEGIVGKVNHWVSTGETGLAKLSEVLDRITVDEDGNNLPDWYDQIAAKWDALIGSSTDLIPFTQADDKFLVKLQDLRGTIERWLQVAMTKADDIQDKIAQAKAWLTLIQNGVKDIAALIDGVKNFDFEALFQEIKGVWATKDFTAVPEMLENMLVKAEEFIAKGNTYINATKALTGDGVDAKLDQVQQYMTQVQTWIDKGRAINEHIKKYAEMAERWAKIAQEIKDNGGQIAKEAAEEVRNFVAEAKSFANNAIEGHQTAEGIAGKVNHWVTVGEDGLGKIGELLDKVTADADGNNLPDWYDNLAAKWEDIIGDTTDLIPFLKADDVALAKAKELQTALEEWLKVAMTKADGIQDKIEQVKSWLGLLKGAVSEISGLVEDIKEGDLAGIYERLEKYYEELKSDRDLIKGTDVDDKIKAAVQAKIKDAEALIDKYLSKAVGGDPAKIANLKGLLGDFGGFLSSFGKAEDHSAEYQSDVTKIEVPGVGTMTASEGAALLKELCGTDDGKLQNRLVMALQKVLLEMGNMGPGVDSVFANSVRRGAMASQAFKDAKIDYDSAVDKHNKFFKFINSIGKQIINAILGVAVNALAPGAGLIVNAIGQAFLGDLQATRGLVASHSNGLVADATTAVLGMILPTFGKQEGLIAEEGEGLIEGLDSMYRDGVKAKYQEVKSIIAQLQQEVAKISDQISIAGEQGIVEVQNRILARAKQWKMVKKQIEQKYVNLPFPPINTKRAFRNASRYLYAAWLKQFPKKEIRIGNSMIKKFEDFGIMDEAKAEWDTGFWANAGRGFFGFFGADPFDYRGELNKLKTWAEKELKDLSTAKAWAEVF